MYFAQDNKGSMSRIESLQNKRLREWIALKEKSRNRKRSGKFLIEGQKELRLALQGGIKLEVVLIHEQFLDEEEIAELQTHIPEDIEQVILTKIVYERLAHRGGTEGIIAIAKQPPNNLMRLDLNENPLILIAEGVQKPGNIGALFRTADAAGLDAVILTNPKTDLYNPNVIRSSLGCLFTVPVVLAESEEVLSFLRDHEIKICAAHPSQKEEYTQISFQGPTAIVVGAEHEGLSSFWLTHSQALVSIPMYGYSDSLNVSVSAAILVFEALRQRKISAS